MKSLMAGIFFATLCLPHPAFSQVDFLGQLGQGGVQKGKEFLDSAPEKLDKLIGEAAKGRVYADEDECRGVVQLVINVAVLTANMMPFSSVKTMEDDRGPVAKVRMMLSGKQLHLEIFCEGSTLKGIHLPWGEGERDPTEYHASTLDAALGALIIAQTQGAFADSLTSERPSDGEEPDDGQQPVDPALEPWTRSDRNLEAEVKSEGGNTLEFECDSNFSGGYSLKAIVTSGVLIRPDSSMIVRTVADGSMLDSEIPSDVRERFVFLREELELVKLLKALKTNEADTFFLVLNTFDGPVEQKFSMEGFDKAMEPLLAYCSDVATADDAGAGSEASASDGTEQAPEASPLTPSRPGDLSQRMAAARRATSEEFELALRAAASAVQIQLGAFPNLDLTKPEWARIYRANEDILSGRALVVQSTISGGRRFFRLRAGPFRDRIEAQNVCRALQARGQDCLVAVNG